MIIFDLDGTLANCEHRRHFVDKGYLEGCDHWNQIPNHPLDLCENCKKRWKSWRPDWKSFYEACDKDTPIEPMIKMFERMLYVERTLYKKHTDEEIEIWTGRCESVREKTEHWLITNDLFYSNLKMRPIGDYTPDDKLKEKWFDEAISQGKKIEYVFDDRPKVVRMWRRRGIFVFDVNQSGEEF